MTRRTVLGLALLVLVLLFAVPSAAGFYTDWLWYRELGYERVFLRTLNAEGTVFGITFLVVWFVLLANLRLASRAVNKPHIVLGSGRDGQPLIVQGRDRALDGARDGHRGVCLRRVGLDELARLAELLPRRAVRDGRSDFRA